MDSTLATSSFYSFYKMDAAKPLSMSRIQSTAGAIPVRNEKGEFRMEKVKVTRYMPGKIPDYAVADESESSTSDDGDSDSDNDDRSVADEDLSEERVDEPVHDDSVAIQDRRLARLMERTAHVDKSRRIIEEPEILEEGNEIEDQVEDNVWNERRHLSVDSDEESDDEVEDQEAIDRKRQLMREKAQQRREEELMDILEDADDEKKVESEESSDYEEYTDSEDDDINGPRLKPVFVRKSDRVTLKDQNQLEEEQKKIEKEKKISAEKRKKYSSKMVAEAIAQELQKQQGVETVEEVINTDDENEEEEYESWKVRELQRIKRDREEIETRQKERDELERVRNMTEEERKTWSKLNPKLITNKQEKGKYKFLQKYFHRGVFYLDEDDEVLKRNFAQPTLEDHFDKTVLPKVMQVKDFGRAGRTKYTHLVDQDTTVFDNPWAQTTPINLKFQNKGGGMKDDFEKPSAAKKNKPS